jgi:hypothetical protein
MKGVSDIVAGVILIVFVIVLGSIIMTYSTGFLREETSGITNKTGEVIDCSASRAEVFDVYIDFSTNTSRIFVRNSGLVNEEIKSVLFKNKESVEAASLSAFPIYIPKGEIRSISMNITEVLESCEDFGTVKVEMQCRTITFSKSPKC